MATTRRTWPPGGVRAASGVSEFDRASEALAQRVDNLIETEGRITFPAAPALVDTYTAKCIAVFDGIGRPFDDHERAQLRSALAATLDRAYTFSQRSTISIAYRSRPAESLDYYVTANEVSLEQAYDAWIATRTGPLFGAAPDARVMAAAAEVADPRTCRVLDIGAGTGRNALPLARRGHPVDAAEVTAKFADIVESEAGRELLDVRVIRRDVFGADPDLRSDYGIIVLSGVVSEFRSITQLHKLFQLAAHCLASGGKLIANVFLARDGYQPDEAARQFAQLSYSGFFTRAEMAGASAGLPLELLSDDSAYAYEKTHLPSQAWPPTGWYAKWATGRDVFGPTTPTPPIELRWLVYRRTG